MEYYSAIKRNDRSMKVAVEKDCTTLVICNSRRHKIIIIENKSMTG